MNEKSALPIHRLFTGCGTRFNQILEKDSFLHDIVKETISAFGNTLSNNDLFFFEGYKDHGFSHIEGVLKSSENLIPDDSFIFINELSVSTLALAVILQDLSLHITLDGFAALVLHGKNDSTRIKELDNKKWSELWADYLNEARRFSGRQRKAILDDEFWNFKIPDLNDEDSLTDVDKKLIGEFILRNHSRLAHEIAINGFVMNSSETIPFAHNIEKKPAYIGFLNLVGLLARSYNMQIRDTIQPLKIQFQRKWSKPNGVSIIYLMVLLRISNFLQLDATRAQTLRIKFRQFGNSITETDFLNDILTIIVDTDDDDDAELIWITARPQTSIAFVKLLELFKLIQDELDTSWAVLGEVYSNKKGNLSPNIKYRRIRSNMDDKEAFIKDERINFVPENFSFNIDNELPKLLIAPLYGEDPSYGVRELLQNALDACWERTQLEEYRGSISYKPEINIKIIQENDVHIFTIEDNGRGMDLFILKDYFLKAGASFRKSRTWKEQHEDEDGKSTVSRSGRFGIGILAAFLIGNKISVYTRSINSEYAYEFSAGLDSLNIQINRSIPEDSFVGTRIEIPISRFALIKFFSSPRWTKWYTLSYPTVNYTIDSNLNTDFDPSEIGLDINDPNFEDGTPINWTEIKSEYLDKVTWTFPARKNLPQLICNGIIIPEVENLFPEFINQPRISVFDFNGNLNLTLNRNKLTGKIKFINEIKKDVIKDVLANLLLHKSINEVSRSGIQFKKFESFNHPAMRFQICYTNKGFFLVDLLSEASAIMDSNFVNILSSKPINILNYNTDNKFFTLSNIDTLQGAVILSEIAYAKIPFNYFLFVRKKIAEDYLRSIYKNWQIKLLNNYGTNFKDLGDTLIISRSQIEISEDYLSQINNINADLLFETDYYSYANILKKANKMIEDKKSDRATVKVLHKALLLNVITEFLGEDFLIPYDMEERKEKFPFAFSSLKPFIK